MTTLAEIMSSVKDEVLSRYRSPIWGPFVLFLISFHWKLAIFFVLEHPDAITAIKEIQSECSVFSIGSAVLASFLYAGVFPWVELFISRASSYGVRSRNDFQIREREREISQRKLIASQEQATIDLELKNTKNQSKVSDVDLARHYQQILSGENFPRWLKDLEHGAVNAGLNNSIVNYLNKVDSIDGKFINPSIESAHEKFVSSLSVVQSTVNDGRGSNDAGKNGDMLRATQVAQKSYREYRQLVRELLEI